jgi:hypothetical protein
MYGELARAMGIKRASAGKLLAQKKLDFGKRHGPIDPAPRGQLARLERGEFIKELAEASVFLLRHIHARERRTDPPRSAVPVRATACGGRRHRRPEMLLQSDSCDTRLLISVAQNDGEAYALLLNR